MHLKYTWLGTIISNLKKMELNIC